MKNINWPIVVTWIIMLATGYFVLKAIIFMLSAIL